MWQKLEEIWGEWEAELAAWMAEQPEAAEIVSCTDYYNTHGTIVGWVDQVIRNGEIERELRRRYAEINPPPQIDTMVFC